jgi:hypothetical protein
MSKGFPQGGRLSPTLWNLVINFILYLVNEFAFLQAFADDIASLIIGNNIIELRVTAQRVVSAIQNWCNEAGLTINPLKSKIVIFTHRHNVVLDLPIN